MRRVICLLLLLIPLTISAQDNDTPAYRLRVPTVEEYLKTVIHIAEIRANEEQYSDWRNWSTYSRINDIIFDRWRNLTDYDFDLLSDTYTAMGIGTGYFWDRDIWSQYLIGAWLYENHIDLSTVDQLRFEDFFITVTARDFNDDGTAEYVLDEMKGAEVNRTHCFYEAEVVDYLVVSQQGDDYQYIETHLPWTGRGDFGGPTNYGEGGEVELLFEDINADGLPEWIVAYGGQTYGGPGSGYVNTGRLYILAWRNGELAELAPRWNNDDSYRIDISYEEDAGACHGPIPRDVTWEFINVDDDPALEILQHQDYLDNWYCESRETKVFDWDEENDRYEFVEQGDDFFNDTKQCAHRQAEEAMWSGDYPTAIDFYEYGLTLASYESGYENTSESERRFE